MKKIKHELEPFFNKNSVVLILGSLPSVKSRELGFYYMHPQNRFYKTLAKVYNEETLKTITEKKEFLKNVKLLFGMSFPLATSKVQVMPLYPT